MKLSGLLIALRYLGAPKLRVMLLGSILLLGFSAQIKDARADSFNKLSSGKNDYPAGAVNSDDKNDLTLRDAINLALLQNPELAAFSKEMRALEGATLQAGLLRNPELSVNVENIGNIQKPVSYTHLTLPTSDLV